MLSVLLLLTAAGCAVTPAAGLPDAPVTALAFAPGGNAVVVATPQEVVELAWPSLKPQRKLAVELGHVHDLALAPQGNVLAIAGGKPGETGRVVLLNWPAGTSRKSIDAGRDVIYRAAWFPDGRRLALACGDQRVYLAAADGGQQRVLEEHSQAVLSALVIPMSNRPLLLTAGRDQTIRVWNAEQRDRSLKTFDNHTAAVVDLALRPRVDDQAPLVASAGADRTVRFWMPSIGRMLRFSRLSSPPLALCWLSDGNRVAAACQDGRVRIVEHSVSRPPVEHEGVTGWAYSLALSPDGKSLLVGGEGGQLKTIGLNPNDE